MLLLFGKRGWGVERGQRVVEAGRQTAEASANDFRGRGLDGVGVGHARRARIFDNGESAVNEGDATRGVIDTDAKLAAPGTAHNVRFNLLLVEDAGAFNRFAERSDEFEEPVDLD